VTSPDLKEALRQKYLLGSWPRYDWSRLTGLGLRMAGATKSSLIANFVGSVSTEIESWLWAGNNDSVDPELCKALSCGPQITAITAFCFG
jgi:hypothetical protein